MPPKEKRSRASRSREQGDARVPAHTVAPTFRDRAAKERYEKWMAKDKTIIMELNFEPDATDGAILQQITTHGWWALCKVPSAGSISLVREFYANVDYTTPSDTVIVRGRSVCFSAAAINAHYRLPNIAPCQHSQFLDGEVDYAAIIRDLCPPGFDWTYGTDGHSVVNLSSCGLSVIAKAWNRFIMAVLLPSTNQSELPIDRTVLLHSICSGRSIDVGTIIRQSIIYIARQATTGGLGHAALITGLCRDAGVQFSPLEPTVQPLHFSHNNIARMTQWGGGIPRPTGLGFEVRDSVAPTPPPARPQQRFHGLDGRKDFHDHGVNLRAQHRAASRRERHHAVGNQPSSSSRPASPSPPSSDQMGTMMAILERLQVGQTQIVDSMSQGFGRLDRRIGRVESRQIDLAHYVTQCASIQFRHSGLGDLPPAPDSIWQPYSSPEHPQPPPQPESGDDEQ